MLSTYFAKCNSKTKYIFIKEHETKGFWIGYYKYKKEKIINEMI